MNHNTCIGIVMVSKISSGNHIHHIYYVEIEML